MARDYELGIVVNPDVGDEQARAIVERITNVVASHDGQVVRVNAVGRRRLAYPIDHHRDGLYFYFDLILQPQSIVEIERSIRVNEDIIRHLMLVRDSRVVAQQRQREAEAAAQSAQQAAEAAARAEAEAARAEVEASEAGEPTAEVGEPVEANEVAAEEAATAEAESEVEAEDTASEAEAEANA